MSNPNEKPWGCLHCKKRFTDAFAAEAHHKAKHRNKKMDAKVLATVRDHREGGESMADRAIAAELDHAMGIRNPDYDWLVEPYRGRR